MAGKSFQLIGQTPDELAADQAAQIHRLATERARQEIQNKLAARLCGTLGEAGQKTMLDDPGSNGELFS